jgi:hypothetical protein
VLVANLEAIDQLGGLWLGSVREYRRLIMLRLVRGLSWMWNNVVIKLKLRDFLRRFRLGLLSKLGNLRALHFLCVFILLAYLYLDVLVVFH